MKKVTYWVPKNVRRHHKRFRRYTVLRLGFFLTWLRFFLPWLRVFRAFPSVVRQMPG